MTSDQTMKLVDECARISGAEIDERYTVLVHFKQAMACGFLAGDEFRVIAENNVHLMSIVADHHGVKISELRRMADRGELTAQKITIALHMRKALILENSACIPASYREQMASRQPRTKDGRLLQKIIDLIGGIDA